jgi:hypothetical protein
VSTVVGARPAGLAAPVAGHRSQAAADRRLIGQSLEMLQQGAGSAISGMASWARTFGQRMVWALGPDAAQVVLTNERSGRTGGRCSSVRSSGVG